MDGDKMIWITAAVFTYFGNHFLYLVDPSFSTFLFWADLAVKQQPRSAYFGSRLVIAKTWLEHHYRLQSHGNSNRHFVTKTEISPISVNAVGYLGPTLDHLQGLARTIAKLPINSSVYSFKPNVTYGQRLLANMSSYATQWSMQPVKLCWSPISISDMAPRT